MLTHSFFRCALPLCLLAFTLLNGSCSKPNDNTLVIGMEMSYPPFEMRGIDNQPDGISVRMGEDLARHLGRPVRFEDVAWDGIIPSLKAKKIDLIISSMTKTEERAKTIDFSDGYVTNGLCMLVGKDSPIRNADDLPESNATIAVKLGTTGHVWAQQVEGVKLVVLDEAGTCALEVAQGKADVFIYDQISIYQLWKQHQEKTRAILNPIREETWAIGIRKGDDALRESVNEWMRQFREAGKFNELADRYMAEEKKTFQEMGVPFIFH